VPIAHQVPSGAYCCERQWTCAAHPPCAVTIDLPYTLLGELIHRMPGPLERLDPARVADPVADEIILSDVQQYAHAALEQARNPQPCRV
jgi:hypothetical protein